MAAVRGSSSRRGSRALRELVDLVGTGGDIAITPDGPAVRATLSVPAPSRWPRPPLLAPVHAKFSRCLRMKTWDGFIIPLPFSKVSVTVDNPIPVPRELTDEEFKAMRSRVETLLKNEAD